MSTEFEPPQESELTTLKAALGALIPARGRLDRDRVMFRAGQSSAPRPRLRGWPALAGCLASIALGEAALLSRRPAERIVERVVVIRESAPTPVTPTPTPTPPPVADRAPSAPAEVFTLGLGLTAGDQWAGRLLRHGLDGLPPEPTPTAWGQPDSRPMPSRQILLEELTNANRPGDLL